MRQYQRVFGRSLRATAPLVLVLGSGCGPDPKDEPFAVSEDGAAEVPENHTALGPFGVRHELLTVQVGDRSLPTSLWLPAEGSAETADIVTLLGGDQAESWRQLLAEAPEGCPSTTVPGSGEAEEAEGGPWPLVIVSHCHECTRASKARISAHLASHGIASLAPDHVGNTLWDMGSDDALPLDTSTLAIREADLIGVLDAALAGELGTDFDPEAVGVMGHSFGSVTAGRLAQDDPRVRAAVGLAAPMENPLLAGVDMDLVEVPVLLLEAEEDNSITEFGNELITANADEAAGGATLARVADAGHWSLSDLCGLVDAFSAGCGSAPRQTEPSETVEYPDPGEVRAGTAALVTAFFAAELQGDAGAVSRVVLPAGFSVQRR
jgi:predicted dienelactone hydrolase